MSTARPDDDQRCPCTSGDRFGSCCAPLLNGASAPSAARLMRSRFTAFAIGDAAYLLRSWHPSTRPGDLELDGDTRWQRLDILNTVAGGPFDSVGVVEFEAFYCEGGKRGSLRERSRFVRENRAWLYVDGVIGTR